MKLIPITRCAYCEFFVSVCNDINDERKESEACFDKARCSVNDKSLINFDLAASYRAMTDYDSMDYIRTMPDWCSRPNQHLLITKCVQCPLYLRINVDDQSTYNRCVELDQTEIYPWNIDSHCPYADANEYGELDIDCAKTGVVTINHIHNLIEDMINYGINISTEVREKEYYDALREEHDLPENYDFDEDPLEIVDADDRENTLEFSDCDTELIGFIKNEDGIYVEDPEAEYSCECNELWGHVTRSKYVCKCNHGSPCIPYQCDLQTDGNEWAFTLPPDVWGCNKPNWMKIYKLDKDIENITSTMITSNSVRII